LLAALGEAGRSYYAHVQLRLDTLYPLTYAVSRGLLLLWLAAPGRASADGFSERTKVCLLIPPIAACLLDWLENQGIATMIETWPDLSPATVARTSVFTEAKSAASVITETSIVMLLGSGLWRWLKGRRAGA